MGLKSVLLVGMLFSVNAFAAEKITCTLEGDKDVVATLEAKGQSRGERMFELTLDDDISSAFLSVEEHKVFQNTKKKNADVLDDSDGNYVVKISFRKGFLSEKAGAKSRAFVVIDYNDIETDHVSHALNCTVQK